MIASVLTLGRADCQALKIEDAYGIHKTVYSLFPKLGEESRDFLFADQGGDFHSRRILILSRRAPGLPAGGALESKEIPAAFLQHEKYGFEVRLNPTKRDKATGKTVAIRGKENLLAWFTQKAPTLGFTVEPESLTVRNVGVQSFSKDGATVLHGTATFVGKLVVTDRTLFIDSFEKGIGRAKAFGFGLLHIIPLAPDGAMKPQRQDKE